MLQKVHGQALLLTWTFLILTLNFGFAQETLEVDLVFPSREVCYGSFH